MLATPELMSSACAGSMSCIGRILIILGVPAHCEIDTKQITKLNIPYSRTIACGTGSRGCSFLHGLLLAARSATSVRLLFVHAGPKSPFPKEIDSRYEVVLCSRRWMTFLDR